MKSNLAPLAAFRRIIQSLYSIHCLSFLFAFSVVIVSCNPINLNVYTHNSGISTGKKALNKIRPISPLLQAAQFLEHHYIDTFKFDKNRDTTIEAMLARLDPYSSFLDSDDVEQLNWRNGDDSLRRYGFTYYPMKDSFVVTEVIFGSVAYVNGLLPGDRFISCDGIGLLHASYDFFDSLLETRREKGAEFTVFRPSLGLCTMVRMRRGALPANNDYYGCMLDDSTAYIWFGSFTHQTYSKISRYVNEFCFNHHAPMLIIDLRSNGGGTLSDAIDLANLFSTRKDTIITLQSHAHGHEQIFRTTTTDTYKNVKIAVLVNENTASASEVFAGVMQDWDRAVIIGQPTHGKGLVMTPYELNNGTVIEPVSYEYRLPSGRCIQKPYVGRFLSDPVPGSPTIFFNYTHRYEQAFRCDSHIYHSRKLNRPLWGNMGIIPDVFVGGWSTNFAFEGIEYDALRNIWFGFLTRYQKTLTAHSTIGEFLLDFPIKESTIWVKKAFQSYPNSHPLDVNAFTKNLAVFLGQRCFTLSSQSPAMLRQDDYVQVAMQVLREEDSKSERTNQKRKTKLSNDVSLSER